MSYVKKMQRFFHDVRIELKKVNWPSRRELIVFTGVVIAVILIIGIFFWILDSGFTAILRLLIR
ncbi:MAG TPA: preprotein translocase subunit SecE [Firmicutes bacterium]|jgi:preprotein translocase subunit SecE|nr:preprotein translocase subunit SecE [Bacillota bacterium]